MYHIKCKKGDIGEYVILCGSPARARKIASSLSESKLVNQARGYDVYSGYLDGVFVTVASVGIGGPSLAIAVEELYELGARCFIRLGTCGSLQEEVKVGDLVVAQAAVRDEGTSRQYISLKYPAVADFEVVESLIAACKKHNVSFHVGVVHSKDAFYAELRDKVLKGVNWDTWRRAGVLATEMECATLFVVSSLRRARAGALLMVVGETWNEKLIVGESEVGPVDKALPVVFDAIRLLASGGKGAPHEGKG